VVLIPPKGRNGWQARYVDPDSGKRKWATLPALATTIEAREQWAVRKSHELAKGKEALAASEAADPPQVGAF
jgi:hypothetical protein